MEKTNDIDVIIQSITAYQKLAASYSKKMKKLIDKLSRELNAFESNLKKVKTEADYLILVKKLVLSINKINEQSDFGLIETVEREDLYSYIESVSTKLGFAFDYDITEEYREW